MPWPFRRKRPLTGEASSPANLAFAPKAPTPPRPPQGRAWAELRPLTLTLQPAPRVGDADRFVASLPGTQPLVHPPVVTRRSEKAPRGLIRDLAEPIELPEPPPAPAEAHAPSPTGEIQELLPQPPPRRLAPIARPVVDSPPLTRVSDELAHLRHTTVPTPSPAAVPEAPSAPGSVSWDEPGTAEVVDWPSRPARPTLGQSRRLGLGVPVSRQADQPWAPPAPMAPTAPESPELIHHPAPVSSQPDVAHEPDHAPEPPPGPSVPSVVVELEPKVEERPSLVHRPEPPAHPAREEPAARKAPPEPVLPRYRPAPAVEPRPLPAEPRDLAVEAPPIPIPTPEPVPVPHDIANAFQATHGVSVRDVPVHRGPQVASEARSLAAVSFARREEVFLPAEAGRLDEAESRGLLAHELTHVVQHKVLGGAPREGSEAAEVLEAEAQAAERFFRGDAGAPAPRPVGQSLVHPPKPTVAVGLAADTYADQVADELVSRGIARRGSDGSLVFGPSPEVIEAQVSEAVQRATTTADRASSPRSEPEVLEEWSLDDIMTEATERQEDRAELTSERDVYLAQLVIEENQFRAHAGEPPLQPETDGMRFLELREEADREFAAEPSGRRRPELEEDRGTVSEGLAGFFAMSALDFEPTRDEEHERERERQLADERASTAESPSDEEGTTRNVSESGRPELTADDMDLADVVRRSWELTRMELRHELLIDRERRGWLTDFR